MEYTPSLNKLTNNTAVIINKPKKSSAQKTFNDNFQPNDKSTSPLTPDFLKSYLGIGSKFLRRAAQNINTEKINEKANEAKLISLFLKSGCTKKELIREHDLIKRLSRLDYDNVAGKYRYYNDNLSDDFSSYKLDRAAYILEFEELTPYGLASLHNMQLARGENEWDAITAISHCARKLKKYDEFDLMATSEQSDFIRSLNYFLDEEYIKNLSESDALMQFGLIKDIIRCDGTKALKAELTERMKNKPVSAIDVDRAQMNDFIQGNTFSYENLKKTIGSTDLSKYKKGFPLKYLRQDFISDFNKSLENLSSQEKKQVFDYYNFSIDSKNDIVKFPVPNDSDISGFSSRVQSVIKETSAYVNDFTLNNSFILAEEDKETQDVLNEFIKVFPEFISIAGKEQHRGDAIDFHTIEDLQLCLNDPATKTLSKEDQRILFLSVMFHDIAKKEKEIDAGHQRPSAHYAKEILKKLPVSFDEKERIYNLILNSHWTTEGKSSKDLAAVFRHTNDFKMAQILAKADTKSAGFEYNINESKIEEINSNIDIIQSNGIPLFADNLPVDKSKFPQDDEGVLYLDFTDSDSDLSQYGFADGTKVKDLNLLCHSSGQQLDELSDICDDSKEICLSSSLLSADGTLRTGYNHGSHVILHSSNSDIALGGIHVSATGGQRGFEHFKDYIYGENHCWESEKDKLKLNKQHRSELPEFMRNRLNLSDVEYLEFYSRIEHLRYKNDICDVKLNSGRILKSDDIKSALNDMHEYLMYSNSDTKKGYQNEIVVFQPKIEAVVMSKSEFMNASTKNNKTKKAAKENNIPVILV